MSPRPLRPARRSLRRPILATLAAAALTACAATAVSLVDGGGGGAPGEGSAALVGRYVWTSGLSTFGGLSGLELGPEGLDLLALSDRASVLRGRLTRDARGAVTDVEATAPATVLGEASRPVADLGADSEGLAVDGRGAAFVSFEGIPAVRRLGAGGEPATLLPASPAWDALPLNRALEALAVDARGALYAIPEAPEDGAFAVYRLPPGGEAWEVAFRIRRRDGFRVTGADIGPDDRLTVVERHFSGWTFRSRVRRFDLDGGGEVTLWTTGPGEFDNLEGVAVWRDEAGAFGGGLRATLVSDDNFRFFQQTLLVDLRLPD